MRYQIKKWSFIFFALLISFTVEIRYSTAEEIPDLTDAEKKKLWIHYLTQVLPPEVAKDGYRKEQIMKILDAQAVLIDELKREKGYEKHMAQKPGPYVFKVYEVEPGNLSSPEAEEAVEAFKKELLPVLSECGMDSWRSYVQDALYDVSREVVENNLPGVVVGLAQCLPENKKRKIFEAGSLEEQVEILLNTRIDEDSFHERFDPKRLGWDGEGIDIHFVRQTLKEGLEAELKFQKLLVLYWLLVYNPQTKVSDDHADSGANNLIEEWLREVRAKDLAVFLEGGTHELYAQFKKDVKNHLNLNDSSYKNIERALTRFERVLRKKIPFSVGGGSKKRLLATVWEVPALVGSYRGCVGGDCSTTYSWAFNFSPFEHTFFIYDDEMWMPWGICHYLESK